MGPGGGGNPAPNFQDSDATAIRDNVGGVRLVAPSTSRTQTVQYLQANLSTRITGTTADYLEVGNWQIADGRIFNDSEERSAKPVCVIGETVRKELFGEGVNPLGEKLRIRMLSCEVIGLLAAVIARHSTGQGQHVDISMTDCAFSLHAMAGAGFLAAGQEPDMENQALNGGSFYDYYRTRDGRWLSVGSLEPQFMQQFCAAIGRPELAALGLSPKDQKALKREIEIEIEKHDLADWQQRFAALDACVEPVLKLSEAVEHPQLKARGVVTEVPREGRAAQRQLACPIRFSAGLEPPRHIGVAVGAHSDEVLRELGSERQFGVTGTDISLNVLNKAREAVYSARKLEQMDSDLCERYFLAQADGRYQVVPDLVARVCVARLNVLELAKAPQSGMDVIFCQNLLIYFRRWRRREILNRLAERLAPGGMLVVGVGEVVGWQHPDLVPVADERVLAFTRKG